MNSEAPLISATKLQAVFAGPVVALRDVKLRISGGEFVSIVGPSGCGKSTLLRLVAGLLEPSSGELAVDGMTPSIARCERVRTSFVFQDPTLLPWRTVFENVRIPLELLRSPKAEQAQSVEQALQLVGLADFARRFPAELSGGMRMRASLARALVTKPSLLLLDEPFAALDDITRQTLNEELLSLWKSAGWTAIFVTHNIAEAVFLSERVLVMSPRPGTIVADVPISLAQPRTLELRAEPEFARLTGEVSRQLFAVHR